MERQDKLKKREFIFYLSLTSIMLLILSAFLISFYKSMGKVLLVLSFSAIVYFVLLLMLTIKNSLKARYIFLNLVVIILLFLSIELPLRIMNYPPNKGFKYIEIFYKRINSLVNLREKKVDAMPFIAPDLMRKFSKAYGISLYLSGVGNTYTIGDEEDDGLIIYKSDENGFRNPPGLYSDSNNFDILLLGDSFTLGAWVPDGYTIADYIRKEKNLLVYNAGYGGTGLISQLAIFLEYGLIKKPKNIVLVVPESTTLSRTLGELEDEILKRYFTEFKPRGILERNSIKDKELRYYTELEYFKALLSHAKADYGREKGQQSSLIDTIFSFRIFMLIANLKQNYIGEGYPTLERVKRGKNIMEAVLRYFQTATKGYGGSFLVVYLPDARYCFKKWPDCEYEMVSSLCRKLNIQLLDMVSVFSKFGNPKDFFALHNGYAPTLLGHCNKKGYELIAKEICKRIGLNY